MLKTPFLLREESDINRLSLLLKDNKFFQKLSGGDIKELASTL